MKRDALKLEMVKERIKNQWNDQQRMELADFIIGNNEDELIIPQVLKNGIKKAYQWNMQLSHRYTITLPVANSARPTLLSTSPAQFVL